MPPTFTALAIAEARANAIGAVRLRCEQDRLDIELVHVAWHAAGFAPGAVAAVAHLEVPYTAIRGLFRHGRALCLAIDPAVCAPYSRFALARFTDEPVEALARAYQARLRARLASFALPLPLGAIAAAVAPSDLASGPLGLASLAALVALACWLALRRVVHALTWGGPLAERRRNALEEELSRRMGFAAPAGAQGHTHGHGLAHGHGHAHGHAHGHGLVHGHGYAHAAIPPRASAPAFGSPLLRARVLLPIALTAAGVVGVMAFVQRFATPRAPTPLLPIARVAPAARALAQPRTGGEPAAEEPRLPRCLCERADSPLWSGGLPRLSLLPSTGPEDPSGPMQPVDGRYDFDLAVVNNGAEPLRDVSVLLTFARRDAAGRRRGLIERGLFWEGELRPGAAVKWHVKARGTEVKVEPGVTEALGSAAAPPDAFFALTRARYRSVRAHAAMMLAYLRDPRAIEALRALGPPSATEATTFARIRRAAADMIACEVAAEGARLRACVFNASTSPQRGATLREIIEATDARTGGTPRRWTVEATVPVHEGVLLDLPLEGDEAPAELAVEPRAP